MQKALQRKRRRLGDNVKYKNLAFVPATSNSIQLLFSNCRLVLADYRKSMTPYHFECAMFLKANGGYWKLSTVNKVTTGT